MKTILGNLFFLISTLTYSQVIINEIQPANSGIIADSVGDYDDWIELYNPGPETVNIAGLVLKDKIDSWKIPEGNSSTVLQPGDYFILWADDEVNEGMFHTNFKLSASEGEFVGLYESDSTTQIDTISFPPISRGYCYARCGSDRDQWLILTEPSPLAENKCNSVYIQDLDKTKNMHVSFSGEYINIYTENSLETPLLIKLYDITGVVRYTKRYQNENIITININNLNEGLYILVIHTDEVKMIKKMVIHRTLK